MQELPKINKIYNCFDDGKIKPPRLMEVNITKVIAFAEIDKATLDYWSQEVKSIHWLYNPVTDYFVKGHFPEETQEQVFVRTLEDNWFSLGYWASALDVDGELMKRMMEYYPDYKEN